MSITARHTVEYLDVVIIRSCQLNCPGCSTFSNRFEINGVENVDENVDALKFWAERISPKRLTIFGGEPLLHPKFMSWVRALRNAWPNQPIWVNTNGHYIDNLFDHINELFVEHKNSPLLLSVSKHTALNPYGSLVDNLFDELLNRISKCKREKDGIDYFWRKRSGDGSKKFYTLSQRNDLTKKHLLMTFCNQYQEPFVSHYQNTDPILPWYNYDDSMSVTNHHDCHIKDYVQLYRGRLYKCPPRAVLNHTLETLHLQDNPQWASYYNDYQSIGINANEEDIAHWIAQQKLPENTCNMCGFANIETRFPVQEHLPKKFYKLKRI